MTQDTDREARMMLDLMPTALRDAIVLSAAERNSRFAAWFAEEARSRESARDRAQSKAIADDVVRRMRARKNAAALEKRMPYRGSRAISAEVVGTVSQVRELAAQRSCTPLMDQAIAAGAGVELWDAPCESWLEIPTDLAHGECFAFPVIGESMTPFLEPGDRILVRMGPTFNAGDVVVARTIDDGYVVKQAVIGDDASVRLCSVNPEHADLALPSDPSAIVGTVVARFRRES